MDGPGTWLELPCMQQPAGFYTPRRANKNPPKVFSQRDAKKTFSTSFPSSQGLMVDPTQSMMSWKWKSNAITTYSPWNISPENGCFQRWFISFWVFSLDKLQFSCILLSFKFCFPILAAWVPRLASWWFLYRQSEIRSDINGLFTVNEMCCRHMDLYRYDINLYGNVYQDPGSCTIWSAFL